MYGEYSSEEERQDATRRRQGGAHSSPSSGSSGGISLARRVDLNGYASDLSDSSVEPEDGKGASLSPGGKAAAGGFSSPEDWSGSDFDENTAALKGSAYLSYDLSEGEEDGDDGLGGVQLVDGETSDRNSREGSLGAPNNSINDGASSYVDSDSDAELNSAGSGGERDAAMLQHQSRSFSRGEPGEREAKRVRGSRDPPPAQPVNPSGRAGLTRSDGDFAGGGGYSSDGSSGEDGGYVEVGSPNRGSVVKSAPASRDSDLAGYEQPSPFSHGTPLANAASGQAPLPVDGGYEDDDDEATQANPLGGLPARGRRVRFGQSRSIEPRPAVPVNARRAMPPPAIQVTSDSAPARHNPVARGGTGDSFASTLSVASDSTGSVSITSASDWRRSSSGVPDQVRARGATSPMVPSTAAQATGSSGDVSETNWNGEFQEILELPENSQAERLVKYNSLSSLSKDFVHIAKTFGKIIIAEQVLPVHRRTIKPMNVGGQAGGEKYIYHGILYKFAVDWLDIYGSDEYAMKAASLELKAVTRFYGVDARLHIPLVALIDYRGWRLVAMSVLPITNRTLIYGSNDGGKTVRADLPQFNKIMRKASKKLGIKGHWCGIGYRLAQLARRKAKLQEPPPPETDEEKRFYGLEYLYAPCDIEGHLGFDERFYCIDFARTFPPTAAISAIKNWDLAQVKKTKARKTAFLYRQFRPEYLQRLGKALSPDCFSPFGNPDNLREHNDEAIQATERLVDHTREFAHKLLSTYADYSVENPSTELEGGLTELLHREGINCRYLGLIRATLSDDEPVGRYVRTVVLTEMVSRVAKNCLRHRLRGLSKQMKTLAEDPYRKETLRFLNIVLGWPPHSGDVYDDGADNIFWRTELPKLCERSFPGGLEGHDPSASLMNSVLSLDRVMKRIQRLTGVRLTDTVRDDMKRAYSRGGKVARPRMFRLVVPDIFKVKSKVKHLPIVPLAEGNALAIESSLARKRVHDPPSRSSSPHVNFGSERLFRLAMTKFEEAIRSTPDNQVILNNYGDVLCALLEDLSKSSATDIASVDISPPKLIEALGYAEGAAQKYAVARNVLGMLRLVQIILTNKVWSRVASGIVGYDSAATQKRAISLDPFLVVVERCFDAIEQLANTRLSSSDYEQASALDLLALVFAKRADLKILRARLHNSVADYARAGQCARFALESRQKAIAASKLVEMSESLGRSSGSVDLTGTSFDISLRFSASVALSSAMLGSSDGRGQQQQLKESGGPGSIEIDENSQDLLFHPLFDDKVSPLSRKSPENSTDTDMAAAVELVTSEGFRDTQAMTINAKKMFSASRCLTAHTLTFFTTSMVNIREVIAPTCDAAITRRSLGAILALPSLASLDISSTGTDWKMVDLAPLERCPSLIELRLKNLRGVEKDPAALQLPKSLRVLRLQQNGEHFDSSVLFGTLADAPCELDSVDLSDLRVGAGVETVQRAFSSRCLRSVRDLRMRSWHLESFDYSSLFLGVGVLQKLEHLFIDGSTSLDDDAIDALISLCPNILSLSLQNCSNLSRRTLFIISGETDQQPGAKYLEHLDVVGCNRIWQDSHAGLGAVLETCRNLRSLKVSGAHMRSQHFKLPVTRDQVPGLSVLSASDSPISDRDVALLLGHSHSSEKARGKEQSGFGRGRGLQLKLVSPPSIKLNEVRGAQKITISGGRARITDATIDLLVSTPAHAKLSKLHIAGATISDAALTSLLNTCHHLTDLDISGCTTISDSAFSACLPDIDDEDQTVSAVASRLQELRVRECRLTTDAIVTFSHLFPELRVVDISGCKLVDSVNELVTIGFASSLRWLSVKGCDFVADEGISEIIGRADSLEYFDLSDCRRITDVSFLALVHLRDEGDYALAALEELVIGHNKLSEAGFQALLGSRGATVKISDTGDASRDGLLASRFSQEISPAIPSSVVSGHGTEPNVVPTPDCLRALAYDLKTLSASPIAFASAMPLEDDMLTWHMNITAEDSPYSGATWHIELRFPADYPNSSPSAAVLTDLPHPHVIRGRVCLDILSDYQSFFDAPSGEGGGWSSAYGVRTIMLQIQSFLLDLSSTAASDAQEETADHHQPVGYYLKKIPAAVAAARKFSCARCSHTSENPWPPFLTADASSGTADPKGSAPDLEVCYFSRCTHEEDTLGIGITLEHYNRSKIIKSIDSPLELLGKRAFFDRGVRTSVNGATFQHWVPLVLTPKHAVEALEVLPRAINRITACNEDLPLNPMRALEIITKLMNTMIVKFMNGEVHASLRALNGYCWLHRWLLLLCEQFPELVGHINETVEGFRSDAKRRVKKVVPALGEFLPLLLISDLQWKDISLVYLQEHMQRNVFWLLKAKGNNDLALFDPDEATDATRAERTFAAGAVGFRLLAFHVYFLDRVGRSSQQDTTPGSLRAHFAELAQEYDQRQGQAPERVRLELQDTVKSILQLSSWSEFFSRVDFPEPSHEELLLMLRESVFRSLEKGYHKMPRGIEVAASSVANEEEDGWQVARQDSEEARRRRVLRLSAGRGAGRGVGRGAGHGNQKGNQVCRAWQAGKCKRGAACRFPHTE